MLGQTLLFISCQASGHHLTPWSLSGFFYSNGGYLVSFTKLLSESNEMDIESRMDGYQRLGRVVGIDGGGEG